MKKGFIFGLLALASISSTAIAAPTSLSTINTWETATGLLATYQNQVGTASWNYDTDLSVATSTSTTLASGTTITTYTSPSYTLTGTGGTSFENQTFSYSVINDISPATDISAILNSAIVSSDLLDKMVTPHGLNPNDTYDMVLFDVNHAFATDPNSGIYLSGLNIFKADYFSSMISALPTAEELLSHSLFTYGVLTAREVTNTNPTIHGYASFATSPSAVPVPAAAFMFAPALLGFLGFRRKNKV